MPETKLARINPGLGAAIDAVEWEGRTYWKQDEPHLLPLAAFESRDANTLPVFIEVEDVNHYGNLKVPDLHRELASRGIEPARGAKKADLIVALELHDAEAADASATPDPETLPIAPTPQVEHDDAED